MASVFVLKALMPDAVVFHDVLTESRLLRLGGATKLFYLGLAWWIATRTAAAVDPSNPTRRPWHWLAYGLLCFAAGQAILSTYQVVWGDSPYPSPGDVFFLAAYPLLIAACFGLIRAYRDAGYPVGSTSEHVGLAGVAAASFTWLGFRLLHPILSGPGRLLERVLTASYPILDFVLLIPILILLRIATGFRGGRIFTAWATLLAGIVCLCAGDILYAYFAVMGQQGLDPLVDATYVLAYLFVVSGLLEHRALLDT